jgi:hypothetical protein
MAFFQSLIEFIETVFLSSNPDVKFKLEIKKIENELKLVSPEIYRNGEVTSNFGNAFFILYKETAIIQEILQETINSETVQIANHFMDLLISTGFTGDYKQKIANLSYENLRENIINATNQQKAYDEQNKNLESILKFLQTPEFKKIEVVLGQIDRLYDLCRFNYMNAIHLFDKEFDGLMPHPTYKSVDLEKTEEILMDLYFLVGNYEVTSTQARVITVLAEQKNDGNINGEYHEQIMSSLKKISSVLKKYFNKEILLSMLKIIKKNPNLTLMPGKYNHNKISLYTIRLQKRYTSNIERIQSEIKDKKIESDIKTLFEGKQIVNLKHYNADTNRFLQTAGFPSLLWTTPAMVLKTFIMHFYPDELQALLDDIVVEGFFANQGYKTDFSAKVFTCSESLMRIEEFEKKFEKDGAFDIAILKNLATESHKNAELGKKLTKKIETINAVIYHLLRKEVKALKDMYEILQTLISESHKSKTENISNIKMLFSTARNRDSVENLEKQINLWNFFLEIMKNYVIINSTDKHE